MIEAAGSVPGGFFFVQKFPKWLSCCSGSSPWLFSTVPGCFGLTCGCSMFR